MPINPNDYRKFLADENLTPEHEDAFIHSMSQLLDGIIDRRMHALERMRQSASRRLIDTTAAQKTIGSSQAASDKEET